MSWRTVLRCLVGTTANNRIWETEDTGSLNTTKTVFYVVADNKDCLKW